MIYKGQIPLLEQPKLGSKNIQRIFRGSQLVYGNPALVLDEYPGASVAYSTRKLKSDYTGYCLRVFAVTGSNTLDVGFDTSGYVDEAAITSFLNTQGSNLAYASIWYDQSGNGNNITTNGPWITDSNGNLLKNVGGKLSLRTRNVDASTGVTITGTRTMFVAANTAMAPGGAGDGARMISTYSGNDAVGSATLLDFPQSGPARLRYFDGSVGPVQITSATGSMIVSTFKNASQIGLAKNDGAVSTAASPGASNNVALRVFEDTGGSVNEPISGIAEVIIYASDKSADRAAIVTLMNEWYQVY